MPKWCLRCLHRWLRCWLGQSNVEVVLQQTSRWNLLGELIGQTVCWVQMSSQSLLAGTKQI